MTRHKDDKGIHPFLRGNFAPVTSEFISHPCPIVHGRIPHELLGGQYIRNGGNPVYPPEKGRHYHWFDGDGMLHGVLFPNNADGSPTYTNRHLATPLLTLTLLLLRSPIPSIALLISPLSSLHRIFVAIVQAFFIAVRAQMGVLSVANTSVIWWGRGLGKEAELERATGLEQGELDNRLLATCESGPPLEVRVPELQTVDWDRLKDVNGESLGQRRGSWAWWKRWSLPRVQEDWMTAHPRIDPIDGSLIFYSTQMFDAPHARYSVIDRHGNHLVWKEGIDVGRAKMMHDFAATRSHSILLNLPLTLSPANLFSFPPLPLIHFDRTLPSEFLVFPRLLRTANTPREPIRYTQSEPSLIFHTANAWDEYDGDQLVAVNMLGCRFKSAKLVYAAGDVDVPQIEKIVGAHDIVRLHYHRFIIPPGLKTRGEISHSFPLTAIPFEFPSMPTDLGMSAARYVYGCTMKSGSFDERLGGAAKVDCLVKIDVQTLVQRGRERSNGMEEPVDQRSSAEIIASYTEGNAGPIEIFACPEGWYAQETRFVPRDAPVSEDDGYLLTYVYDEKHLLPDGTPSTASDAGSELWVIDAKRMGAGMDAVVCRIKLPQRVPYGLHGTWLPLSHSSRQRQITEVRDQPLLQDKLALSRIRAFVSIIWDRPMYRDKAWPEKILLLLMWPAAFISFTMAAVEAIQFHQTQKRESAADVFRGNSTGITADQGESFLTAEVAGLGATFIVALVVFYIYDKLKKRASSASL